VYLLYKVGGGGVVPVHLRTLILENFWTKVGLNVLFRIPSI